MIRPILAFSVANRYAVILVTLIATAFGAWSLMRLPSLLRCSTVGTWAPAWNCSERRL